MLLKRDSRHTLFVLKLYSRINSIDHFIKNAECMKKIAKCCSEYFFLFHKRHLCKKIIMQNFNKHNNWYTASNFTNSCLKFNHYNHHIWEVSSQRQKKERLVRKSRQNQKDGHQDKKKFWYLYGLIISRLWNLPITTKFSQSWSTKYALLVQPKHWNSARWQYEI